MRYSPVALRANSVIGLAAGLLVAWLGSLSLQAAGDAAKPAEARPAEASTAEAKPAAGDSQASAPTYELRYQFKPGEIVRWEVEHRSQIRTTVSGTTQTAETSSRSIKQWKVREITRSGNAVLDNLVESVDMRQKMTGRQEVHYNSQTDKTAPEGFQDAARSIGVPLTTFTIDPTGKVIDRTDHVSKSFSPSTYPTIPLPKEPVALGETWEHTYDVTATSREQAVKKVQMRQRMKLVEVTNGVATISVDTHIVSPVRSDPMIEAQLVQSESSGQARFDIEAGRLVSQQTDLDKHVVGFQGNTSSLHCVNRFAERLLTAAPSTASRTAGPNPTRTKSAK